MKRDDGTAGKRVMRKDKSRQDRQPAGQRERVADAQDRVRWMKDHKPSCSRHYGYK